MLRRLQKHARDHSELSLLDCAFVNHVFLVSSISCTWSQMLCITFEYHLVLLGVASASFNYL